MVEAMNEGAVTLAAGNTVLYSNLSFASMLKMPLEKVIGASMDCFVLPDDLASYGILMRRAQEGRSKGEIRLRAGNGLVVPVHLSISPLELEAGAACAIITDLTEHKRNQELLAAQALERTIRAEAEAGRQRIANILESITDSFLALDREWRIADVNQRAAAILGKARSELIGKIFWDVFPQARTSEFYPRCLKAMTERVPAHCEGLSRIAVGSWLEMHVYPVEEGLAIYFRDITDRKHAEEKLAESERRFRLLLNSITDQFFALSKDWRFTYLNQRAAAQMQALGKDPAGLIGKTLWEEFPEVPNEAALCRVMSERVAITDELYYPPLREWVENHMYPSPDGGLVTVQRYVTERKRAEEELRKTQAELAHVTRMTMMVELAASIAHEINQPLGAIVNNSNVCLRLLSAAPSSQAEAREALVDIVNDANRASTIIERIRAMAKGTSPERVSLQPEDLIADTLVLAQGELDAHRIEVRTDLQEDLPAVTGDRIQFQQVLLNLILNAIEAMSGVTEERRVLAIGAQSGEVDGKTAIVLNVRDLGRGFRPEDSERLFDAFYTTKPHGLGMGLRISRSVVEAHGGRLWATLNNGHGATFFCVLPAMGTTRKGGADDQ